MMSNFRLSCAAFVSALSLSIGVASAQDVHFTQFQSAPLLVNPAFTGAFDGQYRAAAVYRDQWRSVTAPFQTFAVSVDAPLVQDLSVDDYLAGGIQVYNDRAGDGNLSNFSALASVAYHKFLGREADKSLSIGFQGGYTQKSIDLSKLYFGSEFNNGVYNVGTSGESLNNKVNYFTLNTGISWSHKLSERVGYNLGVGALNLNQPKESLQQTRNQQVGLGRRYTAQAGAIAYLSDRFSVRPGILYQSQSTATEFVAGNEFNLLLSDPQFRDVSTGVFAGVYYRSSDAVMINAGLDIKGVRFGLSYDYNTSTLQSASGGNGGFEISIRYIAPSALNFARRLVYPCSRF
jgi:type IX secretion system PorP/SprF family membrane protein